ncbi:MAG: hypothetical protein QME66_04275 [Candidatus Eisenbacteria bacterium]|nr:hypothetical protein [Candidatus Eisenbacteria bacterium]
MTDVYEEPITERQRIPLANGRAIVLDYPTDLSLEEVRKIGTVLEVMIALKG